MTQGKRTQRSNRGVNQALMAIFRARTSLSDAVVAIHRVLSSYPHELIDDPLSLPDSKFFSIDPENFGESLALEAKHIRQIDGLLRVRSRCVEANYIRLATEFILSNSDRVEVLIALDRAATLDTFGGNVENIRDALLALPPVDRQSLTVLKLYAALHSYSDEVIRDFFDKNMHSNWIKAALIYPLLYYYSNLPNEASIDKMLLHFVPKKGDYVTDRALMKFFLNPDEDWVGNLSFRSYVGLLSHPYDALEYIVSGFEIAISKGEILAPQSMTCYRRLAEAFPSHRIALSVEIADGRPIPNFSPANFIKAAEGHQASSQVSLIASMLSLNVTEPPSATPTSPLLQALVDTRWSRYPVPGDFDELAAYVQRYSVLTGGRIVDVVTRGLYLFERKGHVQEKLSILRAIITLGGSCDFILMSPGGYLALSSEMIQMAEPSRALTDRASSLSQEREDSSDRVWIMAANWKAAELQHAGQIGAWASYARSAFPVWVHPRYLSGLDWFWLGEIEKRVGVARFQGNPDFVYILFLRLLEKFQRESVSLRLAVEPVARGKPLDDFANWLANNFGPSSVAFVRLFLTPETVLKLRLAGNYTAALTTRIVLLEKGVIQFGFLSGVLSEEDLLQEQESLTATLSRMSVGARQFEIPWATLKVDANARNRDTYSTYIAMGAALADGSTNSNSKRSIPYPYSNGASVEYDAPSKDLPLIFVIAGVLDTFLTHPSAGIESILSVRIRHDSFRREISYAIAAVHSSEMEGVRPSSLRKLAGELEHDVYREVQGWLDASMHTWRKDKPQALFKVIPTKSDMIELIDRAKPEFSLDGIIDVIFGWLRGRLEVCLHDTRKSLDISLYPAIERKLDNSGSRAQSRATSDDEGILIRQAYKSAIHRRISELHEWFRVPEEDRLHSLSVREVIQAVEQRFWPDVASGRLVIDRGAASVDDRLVDPQHIRPLYDMLSEVARNALKHSRLGRTRVRVVRIRSGGRELVALSSSCKLASFSANDAFTSRSIQGHPSASLNAALFAEGKSGLEKIAYLCSHLAASALSIEVVVRRGSYHILAPAEAIGSDAQL